MPATPDADQLRDWVKMWNTAGPELEAIRRRELEVVDTREAIRQIFGSRMVDSNAPPRLTSGLVEQQAWFARLRHRTSR